MTKTNDFLKKNALFLQIFLLLFALACLSFHITRPLQDYDEASYAKVVVDTLKSGDISTFTLSGHSWFDKPPLYFWLSMGSVSLFGEKEFAFRLPSILASLLCLWLVYLIIKELTDNQIAAIAAFLTLLFSVEFYVFATQVRLDSSVIMGILAALYFYIKGWHKEKFFVLIFPALAIGFLFKSFIVGLIVPILLIYSACYGKWLWLKNRFLWIGLIPATILIVPWHEMELVRFGWSFWNGYISAVLEHATTTVTGSNNNSDVLTWLWVYDSYWFYVILTLVGVFLFLSLWKKTSQRINWHHVAAPLGCAIFILLFFTAVRTHLTTYIMPAFPFIAMFVGMLLNEIGKMVKKPAVLASMIVVPLMGIGTFQYFSPTFQTAPYIQDEETIGNMYQSQNNNAPIYSLNWPALETINYYGETSTRYVALGPPTTIKGPFYLVTTGDFMAPFVYQADGRIYSRSPSIKILYSGKLLLLIYSTSDFTIPEFIKTAQ